jgi:hypothetical protein
VSVWLQLGLGRGLAPQQSRSAQALPAIALPIAVRTNHPLSHDREKFFSMQRNAGAGEPTTRRSNDFGAKIFSADVRPALMLRIASPSCSPEAESSCGLFSRVSFLQICHQSFL